MDFIGKVIFQGEKRSGTSSRGEWVSQSFVVEEQQGNYPKKLCFEVFGQDKLDRFQIAIGQIVQVSFDVDAHEYNGRWYNSIRAYDVRLHVQSLQQTQQAASQLPQQPQMQPFPEPQAQAYAQQLNNAAGQQGFFAPQDGNQGFFQ